MSEIPEDIMEAAREALTAALTAARNKTADEAIGIIAAAILAERERCIRICDAEEEFGTGFAELTDRIKSGAKERAMPGWNCEAPE